MMSKYVILQPEDQVEFGQLDLFLNYLELKFKVNTRAAILVETDEAVLDGMLRSIAAVVVPEIQPARIEGVTFFTGEDLKGMFPNTGEMVIEGNTIDEKVCLECGGPLPVGSRKNRRYCSNACNAKAWKREHAGELSGFNGG